MPAAKPKAPAKPKKPTFPVVYWTYNGNVYSGPPTPPTGADGKPILTDPDYAAKYDQWAIEYNKTRADFERSANTYNAQLGSEQAAADRKATEVDTRNAVQRWLGIGEVAGAVEGALAQPKPNPQAVTLPPEAANVAPPPVRPRPPAAPEATTAPAAEDQTNWMNQLAPQYAQAPAFQPPAPVTANQTIPANPQDWMRSLVG